MRNDRLRRTSGGPWMRCDRSGGGFVDAQGIGMSGGIGATPIAGATDLSPPGEVIVDGAGAIRTVATSQQHAWPMVAVLADSFVVGQQQLRRAMPSYRQR